MIDSPAAPRAWLSLRLWLPLAVFLAIVGLKFWQIDRYGSDLPFWDQWDAEGDRLLRPYLEGTLHFADLFQPHNEHRPVLTRVLALGLFKLNDGIWDARVEMLVNALIHALSALCLLAFARRFLSPLAWHAFGVLLVVLFGHVLSWENTLAGFQSQFYFILLFSALHLGGTLLAPPRSWAWWLAPLAGVAALLSMASGLLSAAAILAVVAIRALRDRRLAREEIYVIACNVALFAVGWALKLDHPGHEHLKASGLGVWLDAFLRQFAWPTIGLWAAPLGLLPSLAFVVAYFRRRVDGPAAHALLGAIAWFALQCAALAYGRGSENHAYGSRYTDTLSVGIAIGVLAVGFLASTATDARTRRGWLAYVAVFLGVVAVGFVRETRTVFRETLDFMASVNAIREDSVRRYVANHDPAFFQKLPWDELPYPSAPRLALLLDLPSLRSTLPISVRPPLSLVPDPAATREFTLHTPRPIPGPTPFALMAWSSHPDASAQFTSTPFDVERSHVSLFAAREGSQVDRVQMVNDAGQRIEPLGPLSEGPRWRRLNFFVPRGRYRLEVTHAGPGGITFTAPVTTTTLSNLAVKTVRLGPALLVAGLVAGFLALVTSWPAPGPRSNRSIRVSRAWRGGAMVFVFGVLALVVGPIATEPPRAQTLGALAGDPTLLGESSFQQPGVYVSTSATTLPAGVATRGSWLGSDEFRGQHETGWYPARPKLEVMVAGYPLLAGNRLEMEVRHRDGRLDLVPYSGENPRETWQSWEIALPDDAFSFRIRAVDGSSAVTGWLAFSEPFVRPLQVARQLWPLAQLLTTTCLALTLLYGPGLLWLERAGFAASRMAMAVLAGPLLLVLLGFACWALGGWIAPVWLARIGVALLLVAIGAAAWRVRHRFSPPRAMSTVMVAGSLLVGLAVSKANFSIGPRGELFGGIVMRTLEVGGHSDSTIPFRVVQVVARHLAPFSAEAESYFDPWSFAARGPLAGILAAPVVLATGAAVPKGMPEQAWQPFDREGFAAYRITLIALASLAGWAMFGLVAALVSVPAARFAAVVLLLAPFFTHEMYFTWPKLFTAGLVLTSFLLAHERRWLASGTVLGLGYLFHPLALLSTPFIGLWLLGRTVPRGAWRPRIVAASAFGVGLGACVAAWQAVAALRPGPGGSQAIFLTYFKLADNRLATWSTWWETRWENFANTFLPFHLLTFDPTHESINSYYAPSDGWVHAGFLYWNTLPFALGLPAFAVMAVAIVRGARRAPRIAWITVLGPALFLIVYWGAACSGLMRHCGQVLFVSTIAFGVWSLWQDRGALGLRRLARVFLHPACFAWRAGEIALMAFGTSLLHRVPRWGDQFAINDYLSLLVATLCLIVATMILARDGAAALEPTEPDAP